MVLKLFQQRLDHAPLDVKVFQESPLSPPIQQPQCPYPGFWVQAGCIELHLPPLLLVGLLGHG
jgi:hypothetical protein